MKLGSLFFSRWDFSIDFIWSDIFDFGGIGSIGHGVVLVKGIHVSDGSLEQKGAEANEMKMPEKPDPSQQLLTLLHSCRYPKIVNSTLCTLQQEDGEGSIFLGR